MLLNCKLDTSAILLKILLKLAISKLIIIIEIKKANIIQTAI